MGNTSSGVVLGKGPGEWLSMVEYTGESITVTPSKAMREAVLAAAGRRKYRYEVTACEGRFAEMVEVGGVLVEDHYRGEETEWELLDLSTVERTGWATGKYLGRL